MTSYKLMLPKTMILLLITATLFSCKKNKNPNQPEEGSTASVLVSATPVGTLTKEQMQTRAKAIGFGSLLDASIVYASDFYKIVYKTEYNGKTIEASGLIGIPKNGPANPSIISAQHETRFALISAPSLFPTASTGYEVLASMGYVVVIPDYIGFGSSKDIFHPYYMRDATGSSVVDMIKASKEYLASSKVSTSNRLFLIGYSEGGYATLAAQREIETNLSHELTVTATAAGAGAFDLSTMLTETTKNERYPGAAYLAFLIQSYNRNYDWKRPLTNFFKEPYATTIPGLFNGELDGTAISGSLTNNLNDLLSPTFRADLAVDGKEGILKAKLRENSFFDWYPKGLTRLYHGLQDEIVPYASSQTTFDAFKAAGATRVTLTSVNGTHVTGSASMMLDVLPWLISIDR